jgi:signal transduction histidine kinase
MGFSGSSLRRLHLLLLVYICLLTGAAAVWVVRGVYDDWSRTIWMMHVDDLTDLILDGAVATAFERSLGTLALARDDASPELHERIRDYRQRSEAFHAQISSQAHALPKVWRGAGPPRGIRALQLRLDELNERYGALQDLRARFDAALQGRPDGLTSEAWFNEVTAYNDALLWVLHVASATPAWVPMPFVGSMSVKGSLFTIVEQASRERAIVAGVIAASRTLTEREREALLVHRGVLEHALGNISHTLDWLPAEPQAQARLATVREVFFERYTPYFREVMAQIERGTLAPEASFEWFREATQGIDVLHELKASMSRVIDAAVQEERHDALWRALGRGGLLVALLTVPIVTFVRVRRHVLARLERLLASADGLYRGDLDTPITVFGADEVGHLGTALEVMRRALTDEIKNLRAVRAELERKTAHLHDVNQELEQFAYVAAHDLKAPLRAINGLAHALEEELGGQMTEAGRRTAALLRQRVARMDGLINALLEYSRAGGVGAAEMVDSRLLVQEVVASLALPPGCTVAVARDLPRFVTNRLHLELVFSNLIRNAIEHHHRPGEAYIDIGATPVKGGYRFSVVDDGPGILPEYQPQIFELFRRLHVDGTGTGMGLALVKKIVERVNGRIEVESDGRAGAAFHFTWPAGEVQDKNAENGTEELSGQLFRTQR